MYVSRDGEGKINGSFSRKQTGLDNDGNRIITVGEFLPDDNADLIAYQNPAKSLDEQKEDFYNSEGLTSAEFIKALMQNELDSDSTALDSYKTKRATARAKPGFPT